MTAAEALNHTALSEGLAAQMAAWAETAGASARVVARLRNATLALARATRAGHVCLPLADVGADVAALRADLLGSGVVSAPAQAKANVTEDALLAAATPLLLDAQDRLYFQRDYALESQLARDLLRLAPGLRVLSGGPGTGKTTTMARWLQNKLKAQPGCSFALAAPTGKAAARMGQALAAAAQNAPEGLREALARAPARTLHRLLGAQNDGGFRHHAQAPLPLDLLVVDEASMLDLALATHTLQALPSGCELWLLGDAHQLAAVEAGAVFADIVQDAAGHPLGAAVQRLTQQHRFAADSAIARFAQAVNAGVAGQALALAQAGDASLHWATTAEANANAEGWRQNLDVAQHTYLQSVRALSGTAEGAAQAHTAFRRFRLLCALREGPFGAGTYNRVLDGQALSRWGRSRSGPWYPGRPVVVVRNDAPSGRLNGDIGIALPGRDAGLNLHFERADGGFDVLPAARLPAHEVAWASTVHKAQGSEFERVFLLLPPAPSRALSREGLYTGVTRARRELWLCAPPGAVAAAVAQTTQRRSGLLDRMRELSESESRSNA